MFNFNVSINVYSLDELNDNARRHAIEEHRQFLLNEMSPADFISGDPEYDTPEQLQEQYESEYEYYEDNDDVIIESIKCNEYLFFADGSIANTTHYWSNHPTRGGQTWIKYHCKEYRIA